MNKEELKEILNSGEDSYTEFKEDFESPDSIMSEVCAFAKAKGGKLILGVSDTGEIMGINKDIADDISNWATTKIDPPLEDILIQKFIIENKSILVIDIPMGSQKPYALLGKGGRDYWVRFGSIKRKATYEELKRLYQSSHKLTGDEIPVNNTSISDIDMEYFQRSFRRFFNRDVSEDIDKGISIEQLFENMRIKTGDFLTTAGLLIFGKDPQIYLPYCVIWAVRFKGVDTSNSIIIDKKEIKGRLEDQLSDAEVFLKAHLNLMSKIEGFNREDRYELPIEALREALVNAIAHRDYTIKSNIRLFIFDDRVEIISPGTLPNTVTLENIKYGIHVERNPIIVTYLTKLGKMEQIGMGIPRMITLTREYTGFTPEFKIIGGEMRVVFKRVLN